MRGVRGIRYFAGKIEKGGDKSWAGMRWEVEGERENEREREDTLWQ